MFTVLKGWPLTRVLLKSISYSTWEWDGIHQVYWVLM